MMGITNYPILIDTGRKIKREYFKASKYSRAVDMACSKFRGKWINYKYAKNMDLISARVEAAEFSRKKFKSQTAYIILKDDEFTVVEKEPSDTKEVYGKYFGGSEDKEYLKSLNISEPVKEELNKSIKSLNKTKMSTTKKSAGKKVPSSTSKTTPAKKQAAKKPELVKKAKRAKYLDGKKVTMTNKEMTAKIKKGFAYYTPEGVNKTNYIPERPNQDLVNKDYYELAPQK